MTELKTIKPNKVRLTVERLVGEKVKDALAKYFNNDVKVDHFAKTSFKGQEVVTKIDLHIHIKGRVAPLVMRNDLIEVPENGRISVDNLDKGINNFITVFISKTKAEISLFE